MKKRLRLDEAIMLALYVLLIAIEILDCALREYANKPAPPSPPVPVYCPPEDCWRWLYEENNSVSRAGWRRAADKMIAYLEALL